MHTSTISCLFPVHNEAGLLKSTISSFIAKWQQSNLPQTEIILMENGSSDSSWKIIQSLQKKFKRIKGIRLQKASYGQALKHGLLLAKGKYIFIFNVDFYNLEFAIQALRLLKVADIVIGSKTLAASRDQRAIFRRLTTYFFNVLLRLILNYPGTDTHGIKAFRNTPLLLYSVNRCRTKNELFDTELIIRMARWGANLLELPVTVREIRPTRYGLFRRLWLTCIDLSLALWSKYLHLPSFEKKVVVADDYGISPIVDKAILKSVSQEEVQVVSILANMISKSQAYPLKKFTLHLKFSAHLNLIEGQPISPPKKIPSLVNRRGKFYSLPIFLTRLFLGLINSKHIETELNTQVQTLKKLGFPLAHIDSHQHTHVFPPLWNLISARMNQWQINAIRSQDSTRFALQPQPLKYVAYLFFMAILSIRFGVNRSSAKELNEIIVHPGSNY